jgi:hypothetical protein
VDDITSTYDFCFQHYYLLTQSLCGGIFALIGDTIAQTNEQLLLGQNRDEEEIQNDAISMRYDLKRSIAYFCKGLGGGIYWAFWFDVADIWSNDITTNVISSSSSSSWLLFKNNYDYEFIYRILQTIASILMEQFIACPVLYTFWDIPITSLLRGSPMRQIPAQIDEKLGPLLIANAKVWTIVNIITYNIPLELRVLYTSIADIIWQTINASITSKDIQILPPPNTVVPELSSSSKTAGAGGGLLVSINGNKIDLMEDRRRLLSNNTIDNN